MTDDRQAQIAYSDLQPRMHDEHGRRVKAQKMRTTLEHFLGRTDLAGLALLDVGSSTGYISDELARAGADVVGLDIDVPGLSKAAASFGERLRVLSSEWSEHRRGVLVPMLGAAAAAAAALAIVLVPRQAEESAGAKLSGEVAHGSRIENVDFGSNTGTVFEVDNEGVAAAVVWIADDEEEAL